MFVRSFILATSLSISAMSIGACDDGAPLVIPPAPAASVSLNWMDRTGILVAAARMSPLAAGRTYAAVGVAQYRAADAAGVGPIQTGAPHDARLGAIAGASVQVLSFLFPTAADSLGRTLNGGTAEFARGVAIGRTAGETVIARLREDGFTRAWTGTAPTGAGMWTPVTNPPAGVMLGGATPYFLTSGSQFRPATPPAMGSASFNADLNEVLQFSRTRTADQIALARQWDYAAGTTTAVGYWNKAATEYITAKSLDEMEATRIMALMHAAVFDAQIACWDAKYQYWMLRPYQASTEITTVLPPPNHPAFPSGHSCVSSSAARVLQEYFPDKTTELNQRVTDAGMSRIYAGIHYRFDITAGQQIGKSVAEFAIGKGLQ